MQTDVAEVVQDPQRLSALHELGLLDTPAEEAFDRLSNLAARILQTPVALVSLVDRDRQFFKSCLGLPEPWSRWRETPLSHSFCQHVVASAKPLVIQDARRDSRLLDNLAIRDLKVIAYLGSPLILPGGQVVGSFCVIDSKPRDWTEKDIAIVRDLAAEVMSEIELRHLRDNLKSLVQEQAETMTDALRRSEARFRATFELAAVGIAHVSPDGRFLRVNRKYCAIMHYSEAELLTKSFPDITHPADLEDDLAHVAKVLAGEIPDFTKEKRYVRKDGATIWANLTVVPVPKSDGTPDYLMAVVEDISARVQAQVALAESERRFRALVDASAQIVWTTNADGVVVEDSPSWRAYTGQTVEQWKGFGWLDVFHPEDRARVSKLWRESVANITPVATEFRVRHISGEWRWNSVRGVPLLAEDGVVESWVGMNTDITARKNADAALHARETQLTAIYENAYEVIFALDVEPKDQFRFASVNRRFMETTGLREDQILGKLVTEVIPEPAHAKVLDKYKEAIRNRRSVRWDEISVYPAGRKFAEVVVSPAFGANGNCTQLIGVVHDITARKQAEARLHEQYTELEHIYASVPAGLALVDRDLKFVRINEKLAAINGLPVAEHIGRTVRDVIPKLVDIIEPIYRSVLETGQARLDQEIHGTTPADPEHERDWLASYYPLLGDDNAVAGVGVFVIDVTDQKRVVDELTARNAEMESFVYAISHDLKTPLITIGGFTNLLEKDLARGDQESAIDSFVEIKKAVGEMQKHIHDLLTLSRTGRVIGEKKPVDLNRLVAKVIETFKTQINLEQARVDVAGDLPTVEVDRKGMTRVFTNLIDNALKYRRPKANPVINIGAVRTDQELRLFVRDNGQGIKRAYQQRIFGLFQRADSKTEGTGVGLAISRRLIEVHGGRLWVESEPGRGSTFWIGLPISVMVTASSKRPKPRKAKG